MSSVVVLDLKRTAVIVMDYQVDILKNTLSPELSESVLVRIPTMLDVARRSGMMIIHVVVAFRPGYPEVDDRNALFAAIKKHGGLAMGSAGALIHPKAAALRGEPIVTKHRINPFLGTDLSTLLGANSVDTLVLAGVHTSGVVLSAVRHAVDADYRLLVVRDCCADPDQEVHAMLLDKVIAAHATVLTCAEFDKLAAA